MEACKSLIPAVMFVVLFASTQAAPSNFPPTFLTSPYCPYLEEAFDAYAKLTGKTLLLPSELPVPQRSIIAELPPEREQAQVRIERELEHLGIEVLQDGPEFVRIFPSRLKDSLTNAPLRGAELHAAGNQGMIAAGMMNFPSTDAGMVLKIYGDLTQRTVLRPATLPSPLIHLKNTCPLSRSEAAYAMATVFALNGLFVVEDGERFVQIVTQDKLKQVKTLAPRRPPGAKLLDPREVPTVDASPVVPRQSGFDFERARRAFYDFMHLRDPNTLFADRLVKLYADLADKKAVPSANLGPIFVRFSVQNALTKEELLYAIETTLELNNLAVIHLEDNKVRVGHISEISKSGRK